MDMSFANQALCAENLAKSAKNAAKSLHRSQGNRRKRRRTKTESHGHKHRQTNRRTEKIPVNMGNGNHITKAHIEYHGKL